MVESFPMFHATHKTHGKSPTRRENQQLWPPNLRGKIESKLQDATHQNGSQCNGKDHLHPIARSHETPSCRCDNATTNVWWLQPTCIMQCFYSFIFASRGHLKCMPQPLRINRASNRSNFNVCGAKHCVILDSAQSRKHLPFPDTYLQPCRNQDPACHEACLVFVRNPPEISTKHTCKA